MGAGPISFVYSNWLVLFPFLSGITEPQAGAYFGVATTIFANDGTGPVNDPAKLTNILYYTTAHLAILFSPQTNGVPDSSGTSPPPPLVGRINNATEGSVSVATDMGTQPASAAWWNQTQPGAFVWGVLLLPFRNMRYVPSPRRVYNPPVWRGGSGGGC